MCGENVTNDNEWHFGPVAGVFDTPLELVGKFFEVPEDDDYWHY